MAGMFDEALADAARKRLESQQRKQQLLDEESNGPSIQDRLNAGMSESTKGAATGASFGSAGGPKGAIIGAIIGGLAGGVKGFATAQKGDKEKPSAPNAAQVEQFKTLFENYRGMGK